MTEESAPASSRCVLIFRIGSLGDTLVALPAFRRIRQQEPHAKIVLLTNTPIDGGVKAASSVQVLQGSGLVDDYLEYRPQAGLASFWSLAQQIRRLKPARTVYLMPVRTFARRLRDRLFLYVAGAFRIEGLRFDDRLERRPYLPAVQRYQSEAARLFAAIGGAPAELTAADFALGLTAAEQHVALGQVAALPLGDRILALCTGTKAPANDWGEACWQRLVRQLRQRLPGARLILLGSADEHARCEQLAAIFGARAVNFCGRLTPRQSGALLAHADLFVGHDSGPMHLASAVGTPVVGIFSARNLPGIWFPFGNEANVLYEQVECAGCGLEVCIEQQMRCIKSITVEQVMRTIEGVLRQPRLSARSPRG